MKDNFVLVAYMFCQHSRCLSVWQTASVFSEAHQVSAGLCHSTSFYFDAGFH